MFSRRVQTKHTLFGQETLKRSSSVYRQPKCIDSDLFFSIPEANQCGNKQQSTLSRQDCPWMQLERRECNLQEHKSDCRDLIANLEMNQN